MYHCMLALAGAELISFTVAGAVFWICAENCAGNTGMFQLLLSTACTEPGFLLLTPAHQRAGWGCMGNWEETQLGQLIPVDQRDIPYHMASCSATNQGGGWLGSTTEGLGGIGYLVMSICFHLHHLSFYSFIYLIFKLFLINVKKILYQYCYYYYLIILLILLLMLLLHLNY